MCSKNLTKLIAAQIRNIDVDYDKLRNQIESVTSLFYEAVYRDPWLSQVFRHIPREHIEKQQADFMLGAFGGPQKYSGRMPKDAHQHINISEEMWERREALLKQAFDQAALPDNHRANWLRIDDAFKRLIVKRRSDECEKRYFTDQIIDVPKPR